MLEALRVSAEQDLQPFSQYLWSQGIAHRISEQAHQQVIWVANTADVAQVQPAFQLYQQGKLPEPAPHAEMSAPINTTQGMALTSFIDKLRRAPLISLLIVVSLFVTILLLNTSLGSTIFNLLRMGTWSYMFESGQLWRLVTPIFLHFSFMHLVFNMLMFWYFGRQLERYEPYSILIPLLLLFSVLPNVAQYLAEGVRFGGMSGVVYALLGYCWLTNRLGGRRLYAFPAAMMGLMVAWMIIGFTEVLTRFGFPPMANVAHLGGLLVGLACAFALNLIRNQ